MGRFLFLLCLFLIPKPLLAEVTSGPCPLSCASIGKTKTNCKDWRVGTTCYVETLRTVERRKLICTTGDRLFVRDRCLRGEKQLIKDALVGPKGVTGERGPRGEPGAERIFGNGSAGNLSISNSQSLSSPDLQYLDIVVVQGAVLRVPSGSVIRCTGTFRNGGTIIVEPALRQSQRVGEDGTVARLPSSGGEAAGGASGGRPLPLAAIASLRPNLLSGGEGAREPSEDGGYGGGSLFVVCRGSVLNDGIITAKGADGIEPGRGGGGGGVVVLGSNESVENRGVISALGGSGAPFVASGADQVGRAPGGGGGGGIIHLIAPSVIQEGTINVTGGAGGPSSGPGSISALLYTGGSGGGGCGGQGGRGGEVNPDGHTDNRVSSGESGGVGVLITSNADLSGIF